MWMQIRVQLVVYHFQGHFDIDLLPQSSKHISANFVFGCILVLLVETHYFGVIVTLTSDFGLLKLCAEYISYAI